MALTPAEKQRRYREKRDRDPTRRSTYLAKEKESWENKKKSGKVKLAKDLTPRERRTKRKTWREAQKFHRLKKSALSQKEESSEPKGDLSITRQRRHGRGEAQKRRRVCYAKLHRVKEVLRNEKLKVQMFKKRWQRARKKTKLTTPLKQTEKVLKEGEENVKKVLNFHHILVEGIKKKYQTAQPEKEKQAISKVVMDSTMWKYRKQKYIEKAVGFSRQRWKYQDERCDSFSRKEPESLASRLSRTMEEFFTRDDVSRPTSGKKLTITKNKERKQKRFLNDSLKNLHKKFLAENDVMVSYTVFCRMRPFWVVTPTEQDRDTCQCKTHENLSFLATKLKKLNLLTSDNLEDLTEDITCDTGKKACMYNTCEKCKDATIGIPDHEALEEVTWTQWKTVKEKRKIKNKEQDVTMTQKVDVVGTTEELISTFNTQLKDFKVHQFNISHQFKHYRRLCQQMNDNECLVHIDYSENYNAKRASAISSAHYGASQHQITLHTGIYYVGSSCKPTPFCGISDSLQHGPSAIWIYLDRILDEITESHPEVDTLNIFSDGPTTQYRQKLNFYKLSTISHEKGFTKSTWNFSEAGHGKGAPDGIGAALKRAADQIVAHGTDIPNASVLYEQLKKTGTTVKLHLVNRDEIESKTESDKATFKGLPVVPGTMKLHQIETTAPGHLSYRDVSCMCGKVCKCNNRTFQFTLHIKKKPNPRKRKVSETSLENHSVNRREQQKSDHSSEKEDATDSSAQQKGPSPSIRVSGSTSPDEVRLQHFANMLDILNTVKSFEELCELSKKYEKENKCYDISGHGITVVGSKLGIDGNSASLAPTDIESEHLLYPILIQADGNCLPRCGSLYAFGNQDKHEEIRCRIIIELALNKCTYIDPEFLIRGSDVSSTEAHKLLNAYTMYSDSYIPCTKLNKNKIEEIYETEVMSIVPRASYMGIWQIFALATVLNKQIMSVYPQKGSPAVRHDLHRLVMPRGSDSIGKLHIMWTSTRCDISEKYWVPNHFVALLPMSEQAAVQVLQDETPKHDIGFVVQPEWIVEMEEELCADEIPNERQKTISDTAENEAGKKQGTVKGGVLEEKSTEKEDDAKHEKESEEEITRTTGCTVEDREETEHIQEKEMTHIDDNTWQNEESETTGDPNPKQKKKLDTLEQQRAETSNNFDKMRETNNAQQGSQVVVDLPENSGCLDTEEQSTHETKENLDTEETKTQLTTPENRNEIGKHQICEGTHLNGTGNTIQKEAELTHKAEPMGMNSENTNGNMEKFSEQQQDKTMVDERKRTGAVDISNLNRSEL